jgi:hypothetical protein
MPQVETVPILFLRSTCADLIDFAVSERDIMWNRQWKLLFLSASKLLIKFLALSLLIVVILPIVPVVLVFGLAFWLYFWTPRILVMMELSEYGRELVEAWS